MTSADFDHPYAETATIGDAVFVSGCLPVDETENLVTGNKEVLDAALATFGRRLATIGLDLTHVTKLTYFVTDMADRKLAVAGLPRGASVKIDAIASRG